MVSSMCKRENQPAPDILSLVLKMHGYKWLAVPQWLSFHGSLPIYYLAAATAGGCRLPSFLPVAKKCGLIVADGTILQLMNC